MNWTDEYDFPIVHRDAFGGVVYLVEFADQHEVADSELANDIAERAENDIDDEDGEVDTKAVAKEIERASNAKAAHLVIHANGKEEWTTSGIDFAVAILQQNITPRQEAQPELFT